MYESSPQKRGRCHYLVPAAEHGTQHRVPLRECGARDRDILLIANVEADEVRRLGVVVGDERGLAVPFGPAAHHEQMQMRSGGILGAKEFANSTSM